MFLKQILSHVPEGDSRYATAIRASTAAGAPIAGIWRLFAWKPALAEHLARFTHEVLRGPSPFSPGFRELIAAFTSARNRCLF